LTGFLVGALLPRSLDNLRNFSNFSTIRLSVGGSDSRMEFSGPNGRVCMVLTNSRADGTYLMLGSLAQLDTSKTEQLVIEEGRSLSKSPLHRALLPMRDLRTLTLSECEKPHIFMQALEPGMSSSEAVVCPKLEELILVPCSCGEPFYIKSVITMVAARALRGKKLGTVRIVDRRGGLDPDVMLELKKHICHVEHVPELA
jgi:hypothetical protein